MAPLMGWLSASPFPSDQGESFSLSPLDPSLRGDSLDGEGCSSLPKPLLRQLAAAPRSGHFFSRIGFELLLQLVLHDYFSHHRIGYVEQFMSHSYHDRLIAQLLEV